MTVNASANSSASSQPTEGGGKVLSSPPIDRRTRRKGKTASSPYREKEEEEGIDLTSHPSFPLYTQGVCTDGEFGYGPEQQGIGARGRTGEGAGREGGTGTSIPLEAQTHMPPHPHTRVVWGVYPVSLSIGNAVRSMPTEQSGVIAS